MKFDIGCGKRKREGFFGVDCVPVDGVDIVTDLTQFPWPIEDGVASEIVLDNVIEHLPDTVGTMNELHRISKEGARVTISYPYYKSKGAYGDPTHVHWFNEAMIDYFLAPGQINSRENRFSFYTHRHWRLIDRHVSTYPFLKWVPSRLLLLVSRFLSWDIIHSVTVVVSPEKIG